MKALRNLLHPRVWLSGLLLAATLAVGYGAFTQQPAAAAECDNNAVIKCGFSSVGDFVNKYNANATGDLKNIYAHFGLTDINYFQSTAQHVTFYKNGQIKTDDGTIVATNGASLGRQTNNGNNYSINISGKTYYWGYNGTAFAASSIGGYGIFNSDDHSFIMGVMNACGNPGWGNSPGYKCQMLQQTKVNDTTYSYVATPYTKNGATVSKIVYDFGDGKSQEVTSNFGQSVTHTYAPGDYTARATVYFNINGSTKSDTRADCTKPVRVPQPPKPVFYCTGLVAQQVSGSRTKFTFTASAHVENGAQLLSGTFNFDDGTVATANASGNSVTMGHEYTQTGDHITKADLTFNDGKDVGNVKCVVQTTTTPPTCADTPNAPECQPKTCENAPTMPQCQTTPPPTPPSTPPQLPSTGPEEVISTVLGLSSVTGATVYYRSSRRNLLDRIFKR